MAHGVLAQLQTSGLVPYAPVCLGSDLAIRTRHGFITFVHLSYIKNNLFVASCSIIYVLRVTIILHFPS